MEFVALKDIIKQPDLYFAHKKGGKTEENTEKEMEKEVEKETVWETLEEHTLLCQQYFAHISRGKGMKRHMERFLEVYAKGCSDAGKKLAEQMWCNVVTFHDLGKHNPNFQRNVLERKETCRNSLYSPAGNGHSALSAALFMDYYFKRIKEIGGDEGKKLSVFMVCSAYAIARHHSGLVDLRDFLCSFIDGKNRGILGVLQQGAADFYKEPFGLTVKNMEKFRKLLEMQEHMQEKKQWIWLYFYGKLIYSMLVAADYYATSEFMSGVKIRDLGELDHISDFLEIYRATKVNRAIRAYEAKGYPMNPARLSEERRINLLRNEIFLDAERQLLKEMDKNLFYLEAPTGSGKSNISMNLGMQLAAKDGELRKIYYVYPFNTLVEQNREILYRVFGEHQDRMADIAVVNSITPVKCVADGREKGEKEERDSYYAQALLNRQFLNYPIVLTTHVSLFDTIFGDSKESAFAFHQLSGSIVVLDEIQSYKNSILGEIITFLTELAEFMHMKIIFMSATLPNLGLLSDGSGEAGILIQNREKYFCHPCFQKRVEISRELLNEKITMDILYRHVKKNCGNGKKILVEFITKAHAEEFYQRLKDDGDVEEEVFCMSGDDSIFERRKIIREVKKEGKPVILVATQVVEAGVDIDMDIGYKNIAKMDSEEQFLGRINRSYTEGRTGKVYFFQLDAPGRIYRNDTRSEWEFLITQQDIWDMLERKDFNAYYTKILDSWKANRAGGVEKEFFSGEVCRLDFSKIKKHMQLIDEKNMNVSVYFGRKISDPVSGETMDGNAIWEEYKRLLQDMEMGYAEKRIQLSVVMEKMNCFIYQTGQSMEIGYKEQIGELFYVEDGEKYFENGRLNRKLVQGQLGEFI